MKTWSSGNLVVCGLALVLGACGGDDKEGGGSGAVPGCSDVCAKIAPLMCPDDVASMCVSQCEQEANAMPGCATQAKAAVACASGRPATEFMCVEGEGELTGTACAAEQNALLSCFLGGSAGMGGGMGGSSGASGMGGDSCPFTNDGECDEPDFCPAGTDTADCS